MAKIERYCAPGVFDPATYSQGVKVTESKAVLFIAGQVAYDKDGGPACRGDFKGQAREAFKAIKALVEAQGGTLDNIVKINTYVTDVRYRADLVPVREEFFGKKGPASTLVQVAGLRIPTGWWRSKRSRSCSDQISTGTVRTLGTSGGAAPPPRRPSSGSPAS